MESTNGFEDVDIFAAQRLDLEVTAQREQDYYREMSSFMAPIRMLVAATALLIALGGLLGGVNTMYAAFASRVREIGALQVLGLSPPGRGRLAAPGVDPAQRRGRRDRRPRGHAAARRHRDPHVHGGSFGLIVDGPVVTLALCSGLVLGIIGALPPAWRCLRLPVAQALRS